MVRIPERKEIKLNKNKRIDEETLRCEGWKLCGIKSVGNETVVVFKRAKNDRAW